MNFQDPRIKKEDAQKIKELRLNLKMTQFDLAIRTGLSKKIIENLESGHVIEYDYKEIIKNVISFLTRLN